MSYRPFEPLPDAAPNASLMYTLFAGTIAMQAVALLGAAWLFVKASRADKLIQAPARRLFIVCALVLLGIAVAEIDTETSVWFLPAGQTNWAISLNYLGLSAVIFLLLPTSMVSSSELTSRDGTRLPLMIVSMSLFLTGLGLVSVFWFHPDLIWAVRVTSFAWSAFSALVVAGITFYRKYWSTITDVGYIPLLKWGFATLLTLHTIVFYSLESPIPLLMRFLELLGFIGLTFVTYWISLALEETSYSPATSGAASRSNQFLY